ncbi:MAG: hypothetical protein RMJ51_02890 [Candidatus Calescibacterium sp.]|nr:hypothetical protein [Candidatus Calescibacterium sp.]MCX7972228.1 hypothetical protein [bacterium]MDW8195171.1 hypothetical protein [Candidatus Calescibacterium sp.]
MSRELIFIAINLAKAGTIILLLAMIYFEYAQIQSIKQKNEELINTIQSRRGNLEFLKQVMNLYQREEYVYPYLVRKYGLLKTDKCKLYIMEVEN